MITIVAPKGKYFFSDFLIVFSGSSAVLEETVLEVTQLYLLIVAVRTDRLEINNNDYSLLELAYNTKKDLETNPNPGPNDTGVSLDLLLTKESKENKVNTFSIGSITAYPTTNAVVEYVATITDTLATKASLTQYSLKSETDQKVDKSVLNTLATKTELASYTTRVDVSNILEEGLLNYRTESQIRASIEDYVLNIYDLGLRQRLDGSLSLKVNIEEGKGLSTHDFTTAYRSKLENLEIPTSRLSSTVTTPTVNSLPLYTLNNNGEYVLCTPDVWLKINNFYIPGYNKSTIGVSNDN